MSGDKTRPMYEIIQNDIIEKIQNGTYKEGERVPSEQELIEAFQVSRTTATKALTELSLGGYIHRIQGKGSFVNPLGSHLSPGERVPFRSGGENPEFPRKVGVIIPQYYDHHSGNIIQGIRETLSFPSFFINIALSLNMQEEEHALHYFLQSGHAGILLFPASFEFYSDTILQMTLNKYPLVLMDRDFPGIHCMSVTCDNRKGCELGVSHLVSLGHKGIAFLANAPYQEQVTNLRYNGYLDAMTGHGLAGIPYEDFFHGKSAALMQEDFLQRVRAGALTAAIASNADAALLLYQLCSRHGIRIPQDLSVLCFDNPNFGWHPAGSFFTYLEQNSLDMGRQAAMLLKRSLCGEICGEISPETDAADGRVVLRPELVVNGSTRAVG